MARQRTLEHKQVVSSRHLATSDHRVVRARLVFWRSGASGMGTHAVDKKSAFDGVFKRAPVSHREGPQHLRRPPL